LTVEATHPRVLRVIARLNVGGPARHVAILDRGLRERGWATLLAHGDVGPGEASMELLAAEVGVPTRRVRGLGRTVRPLDDLRAFATLVRLVFALRPDVVHTHTAKAGFLGRLAAWLYNLTRPRRHRCLVVHTYHGHVLHGYFSRLTSAAIRQAEQSLALVTDCVLVLSLRLKHEIGTTYRIAPPDKLYVVPLGLDLDDLLSMDRRDGDGAESGEFVFGYVGRLVPVKNVPMLIRAFERVHEQAPHARLVLVGDGELAAALQEVVTARGLVDAVRFAGWCSDLVAVYRSFHALVLGSVNEGTPVAAIEAMAAGLPVVATAVGGVPDVITDGHDGLLVPSGDEDAMAAAMLRVLRDAGERRRMGEAARHAVRERFSARRLVTDIEHLYRTRLDALRGTVQTERT
jgi:glycosyltransferase involved in cell wall biosynthesis